MRWDRESGNDWSEWGGVDERMKKSVTNIKWSKAKWTISIQFKLAVLIYRCLRASSWKRSAVRIPGGEQLHANRRLRGSSASAVRQSTEVDRSALLSKQFRSSVFCCWGSVDLEFAAWQSSPPRESQHALASAEDTRFAKYWRYTGCSQKKRYPCFIFAITSVNGHRF